MTKTKKTDEAVESVAEEATAAAPELKPIETWAAELGTPKWLFAAMKVGHGYGIGQELTREAYEAACDESANVVSR